MDMRRSVPSIFKCVSIIDGVIRMSSTTTPLKDVDLCYPGK